jgi:chemotaxis protein methyltransferase CheR
VTPADYEFVRKVLRERSGYVLAPDKHYLIDSRLNPVARQENCASLADLVQKMRAPGANKLLEHVTETMTINESFFFRDKIPFDRFKDTILPAIMGARASTRRIRIWCSASSTGQEPYSLAMILKSMKEKLVGWNIEIVATDISREVLERAKAGIYTQFEVQRGLPIQMLMQFFQQVGEQWRMAEEIRRMVQFRHLNLIDSFSLLGTFDVVFCRNVLIYFDHKTKTDVLERIARQLSPEGYLVLGAAETVVGLSESFKPHADKRGLYVRAGAAAPKPAAGIVSPLPKAAAKAAV